MKGVSVLNKIYVVGIGPGEYEQMTLKAIKVLESVDTIIGYTVYVDLIKEYFTDKEFMTTPMCQELERCRLCFDVLREGKDVALICSGDAGVYGMAGLAYEVAANLSEIDIEAEIEVVPGVTAAVSGAAVLGAPLIHDFAVISLSDLLTPWNTIQARLLAAAASDLAVCLYNPSSRKRKDYLKKACEYLMEFKKKDTVCGYVRNIGRDGQSFELCTLEELKDREVDMFTTVFIGNAQTKIINGRMVTPRGYMYE